MIGPTDTQGNLFEVGTIGGFGELIGALPLMFGFRPSRSLVLVTHNRTTSVTSGVMRVDLPSPTDIPALVSQLRDALVRDDVVSVIAVVIDDCVRPDRDTHHALVNALEGGLTEAEITVKHAVWTAGTVCHARWRCYGPCRCEGSVPASETSAFITALTVAGATAADSRDLLAATLAADPEDQLARRSALLESRLRSRRSSSPDAAYRVVYDVIAAAAAHPDLPSLSDEQIVELAAALSDPEVRDRCLTAAINDHVEAAERLWTVLTRATPAPQRTTPALLLAIHTYLRGDGVLAAIALDIARDADPDNVLARVLDAVLRQGTPPAQLRRLLQTAISGDGTHR